VQPVSAPFLPLTVQRPCPPSPRWFVLFFHRRFRTVDLGDVEDEDEDDRLDRVSDDESAEVSTGGWSQMWVLRIRARRDLLDILLELETSGLNLHRVAAIAKMEASILTNKSDLFFSIDLTLQMLVCTCTVGRVWMCMYLPQITCTARTQQMKLVISHKRRLGANSIWCCSNCYHIQKHKSNKIKQNHIIQNIIQSLMMNLRSRWLPYMFFRLDLCW
jgi:hypothetical protein